MENFRFNSPALQFFLLKNATFFIIFVGKIFVLQNIYGFTPFIKILSCVDQKWPKTKQLKMFLTSNCSIGLHSAMVQYSNIFSISASPPPAPAAPNLKSREENGQKSKFLYICIFDKFPANSSCISFSPVSSLFQVRQLLLNLYQLQCSIPRKNLVKSPTAVQLSLVGNCSVGGVGGGDGKRSACVGNRHLLFGRMHRKSLSLV